MCPRWTHLTFPIFKFKICSKLDITGLLAERRRSVLDTIAIFNQKGGVGKTTSVVNFAACLEKEFGKKVLVVDCDSQCNASSYLTTFTDTEEGAVRTDLGVEEYLKGNIPLSDVLNRVLIQFRRKIVESNIYVVRGTKKMDFIDDFDTDIFKRLVSEAEELGFDYVLFDCPANLTTPTLATLSAVRFVLIPVSYDIYSLSGYDMLIDNVQAIRRTTNINLQVLGIFFNNIRTDWNLDKYMYESNRDNLNGLAFKTYIRPSRTVPTAALFGIPYPYYRPRNPVANDYIELVNEIIKRIKKVKKGAK